MKPCYEFAASLIQQYQTQNNDYKNQLNIWKIRQRVLEGNFRQAIKKDVQVKMRERKFISTF